MEKQSYMYMNPNHVVNLNNMRLSGKLCDVTIKVDNKKLHAHKVILAANLKYFESMFLNSFKESKQNVVTMKGIDGTHLEAFIAFAYTGEILITDKNALTLLAAANYLSEEGIVDACIGFLKKQKSLRGTACGAYKLANTIDCLPLKNLTRQCILSIFEDYSQATDFLNFDFDNLKDLLSNPTSDFAGSQHMFFESIMRWIVHDVNNRRSYVNDLLNCIDVTKLAKDYLLEYFCKSIENEEYDTITKDIMSFYRKRSEYLKSQETNLRQHLIMIGGIKRKLHYQIYDFTKKVWSEPDEITSSNTLPDGYIWNCGAMLDNKFYYVIHLNRVTNLHAFDLITKANTMLASESRLLNFTAICASAKYVYFCGGLKSNEESNQVLRYDPSTNSFDTLPPMRNKKESATAIFYQDYLYVLGGSNESSSCAVQSQYMNLDGQLYACGGWRCNNVEVVYDPSNNRWQLVASMKRPRFNFFLVVHEGKLLAVGAGDNSKIEVYDPIEGE